MGKRTVMDRMILENASDHPVIEYRNELNKKRRLIVGYGASIDYADLQDGAGNVKATPKTWGIKAIHFGPNETANGTTRLRTPIDQIPEAGNDWDCIFHNRNTTYSWEIQDWDGNNLATLLPNERLPLLMTRRLDGTGELIESVPFIRTLEFSVGNFGNFGTGGYYDWQSGGFRGRPILYPDESDASVWKMHTECFAFGSGGLTNGTGLFDATPTELSIPSSVIFQKAGKIRASMFVAIATSGGGGSVPDNHGLAFIRLDGSTVRLGPYLTNELIGNNENEVWPLGWEFDAALTDIFLPLFRYHQSTNIGLSNVAIESMQLKVEMTEIIHREYAP